MKTKNIIANILIVIGSVCIIGALILAILNEYENKAFQNESRNIVQQIIENTHSDEVEDLESSDEDEHYDMPVINIDGYDYIGYLDFDVLEEEMPVMSEWDYKRLKMSSCRYSGSLATHDLVIAGHNYRNGFRLLKQLKEGDYVYFTALTGKVYVYQVDAIEVIEPTGIEEMVNSQWDLSLYTCTYEGQMRYTVRCKEIVPQ